MANNEYVIHVVNDTAETNGPVTNAAADVTQDKAGDSRSSKSYWAKSAESAKSAAKRIVSIGTAASVADRLVSYEINTVSLRTGAREYEQKIQFGYSAIKNTAAPLVAGAIMGGLPGALIGGLFSLGMTAISWSQNSATIQLNHQLENISLGMASQRAGYSNSRSDKQ